jgi:hypothetical protein
MRSVVIGCKMPDAMKIISCARHTIRNTRASDKQLISIGAP